MISQNLMNGKSYCQRGNNVIKKENYSSPMNFTYGCFSNGGVDMETNQLK